MMDTQHALQTDTIIGRDVDGHSVTVSLDSVLAIVPDPLDADRTRLHVADGIVLVDGNFENWMDRLAADWTNARH